jgi:hypothetical protein
MDPATTSAVVSTVLSVLIPYLQKAGDKFAEEIGKSIPENVGKLYDAIKQRFSKKPIALETMDDLEKKPNDPDLQAALRVQLRKLLDEDAAFAEELRALLSQGSGISISQTGSGSVATNEGVSAGEQGLAVKGDIEGNITMNNS